MLLASSDLSYKHFHIKLSSKHFLGVLDIILCKYSYICFDHNDGIRMPSVNVHVPVAHASHMKSLIFLISFIFVEHKENENV